MPRLTGLLIGVVVISIIFVGGLDFIGAMNTVPMYARTIENNEDLSSFNQISSVNDTVYDVQKQMNVSKTTDSDTLGTIWSGQPSFITRIAESGTVLGAMASDLQTAFGLPAWFIQAIATITGVVLLGVVLTIIFSRRI